jgi:hypothetical protein
MRTVRRGGAVRFHAIDYVDVALARYEGRTLEVRPGPNGDAEVEIYDGDQRIATAAARTRPTPKRPPPGTDAANGPRRVSEPDHKPGITVIFGAEGTGKTFAVVLSPGSCYVELTFGPGSGARVRCDRSDLDRWSC